MATFNELNVVEFLVIDELSGVDIITTLLGNMVIGSISQKKFGQR